MPSLHVLTTLDDPAEVQELPGSFPLLPVAEF